MELSAVVYSENRSGPRTEPCGTPQVRGVGDDLELPEETVKERGDR